MLTRSGFAAIVLLVPTLAFGPAHAESRNDRPDLPFRSVAGEDGVHVLFQNPALMNFDRDAGYAFYYNTSSLQSGRNAFTLATTGSGVGTAIGYRQFQSAPGQTDGWWTVSSGASLRIAKGVAFGTGIHWQLPDGGDNNFVSWDLGLGWRPVPFLGFGARVLNIGSPAPELGVNTEYTAGLALRPWNDVVTLGLDWRAIAPPDTDAEQHGVASLRVRPARGLWLRAWADTPILRPEDTTVGAAIEVRAADLAIGVDGLTSLTNPTDPGVGGYLATIPKEDQIFLPGRKVASFTLDGAYPYSPQGGLLAAAPEGYLTLLRRIERAARDPQVRGIVVRLDQVPFSFAQVEELHAILMQARGARKSVVVYLDGEASNGAYLLATAADRVYLHPAGGLNLVGLSAELQFYKGALDMVGVEAQFRQRSEYKSAPEQWTRTEASGPAREEMNALLDDLSGALVRGIAAGRGKTEAEVTELVDQGPYTADEALAAKLVDGLIYPDQLEEEISGVFGQKGLYVDDRYERYPDTSGWQPQRAIGVVVVDGAIADGPSSSGGFLSAGYTGSETVVRALDQARRTSAIKGIVLRVDSPGGSAFASDEIWRAVERLRADGKPVVVSMGGYAASGGYYVASNATAIYALPSTITGSIGVYGGKYNLEGLFETLHIGTEFYERGRNASMYSSSKPFDTVQLAALDRMIGATYSQFKGKVAAGRNMSEAQVEELARGRVWSGRSATARGLVDASGGFYDAVERARKEAGIGQDVPYTLVAFDPWGGSSGDLPTVLVKAGVRAVGKTKLGPQIDVPEELQSFWSLAAFRDTRIFAMLPYRLTIE